MIDHSPTGLTVIVHGGDGSTWHVHGTGAGAEGVWCGKDQMRGLWEAPTRTAWESGARQRGGKPRGHWYDPRDLDLGFHLVAARRPGASQAALMSAWWQAFDYAEDQYDWNARLPRIQVISDTSDRWLDVQLREHRDFQPGVDPLLRQAANPILPLRAGMPFFQQEPEVSTWSTAASSGSGVVWVSNPTPLPMFHKWILTRGDWTLPDRSIEGPPHHRFLGRSKRTGRDDSGRDILMPPLTALHGGATVDLDPDALMVRDAHGTNLLGQMPVPGRYFEYEIPPHTQPLALPVSVTNAPAGGAMVQLVMPRLWPEPIGGQ
ncbi:hypothetical protein IU501_10940 [Nocardia otitidiscaviarum]|uniref:hypothetical protein n=1 Tax=Nocardia otitidiscaviarum TaxID=1823 RepID=UPI001895423B|nr:hypothetical protein [Nocardia otitidiscaviarum]MBF6133515.1 hypothetical protein [Nocardia otitidiscaviarum]